MNTNGETETIWPLIAVKTDQIKYNLLELLTTIVDYNRAVGDSGQQMDNKSKDNNVLINRYFYDAISDSIPRIRKTIETFNQNLDKILAENQRLTDELEQYRRRQTNYERQLREVRNLYHNLKDEIDMKEICQLMEQTDEEVVDQNGQNVQKEEFNKLYGYLKTSLELICSSSSNQKTVQSFMDNTESFKQFMASIRAVITDYINYLLAEDFSEMDTTFDPKIIEVICSFCSNVFRCNDYSAQDIHLWIDSLTTLQDMDRHYRKCSTMALLEICFAPNGMEELQKKNGMIKLLAKCLVDTEFKHEFKLKTNAVKVIRLMIENSTDRESRQKMFNEFIQLISIERFQQMTCNEQYIQLKKGMAALLNTLTQFNTTDIIIED